MPEFGIPEAAQHAQSDGYAGGAEKDQGKKKQAVREQNLHKPVTQTFPVQAEATDQLFPQRLENGTHNLEYAVEGAPDDIGPVGTVPQAAGSAGHDDVQVFPHGSLAVAAQRNIDVIPEPAGQGDMPIAPELANVPAEKGGVEVIHQLHTQHFGSTHGNGGIAAKVAIDLDGEKDRGDDDMRAAVIPVGGAVHRVHQNGGPVGDDDLQKEAPEHQQEALPQIVKGETVGDSQLAQQILRPLNGAGHQLGEEGDKKGIAEEVSFRGNLSPVHINGIAQSLEGVEGDAHRQQHVKGRVVKLKADMDQYGIEAVNGEIEILEEEQNRQVDAKAQPQHQTPAEQQRPPLQRRLLQPLQTQAAAIGDQGGQQHQQCVNRVPAHIEVVAAKQQPIMLDPVRNDVVNSHYNGQKDKKLQRVKGHRPVLRIKT